MAKRSAAILLFRRSPSSVEVLLVHPGGPFWARKDLGAWSLPKGEYEPGEDPQRAALREFEEETGFRLEPGALLLLGEIKQSGGKIVTAWAMEGSIDASQVKSNTFEMEWPPKSGKLRKFPEVDRAGWFSPAEAREKVLKGQVGFLGRFADLLGLPLTMEE